MLRAFFHADGKGLPLSTVNGCEGYGALVEYLRAPASITPPADPRAAAPLAPVGTHVPQGPPPAGSLI
jgi:hypothetical protein